MNFINLKTHIIILFLSSFILNIYYICYVSFSCNEIKKPEYCLNNTNIDLQYYYNEYLLNYDQRFLIQQENFQPKDFFPINEYLNDNELKNYNKFYTRHLSLNYPFVLKGETKKWKAYKNWQNNTYLLSKIGNLTIEVEKKPKNNKEFDYFKKDYNLEKMKYKIFLEKYLKFV